MTVTRESVLSALKQITDPKSGSDIVGAGLVKALMIEEDAVRFVIEIDPAASTVMEPVRADAQAAVEALKGVKSVSAVLTAHAASKAPPDLKGQGRSQPKGPQPLCRSRGHRRRDQ